MRALSANFSAGAVLCGTVACTGNRGCRYAATDSKADAVELANMLDAQFNVVRPVNLHVTDVVVLEPYDQANAKPCNFCAAFSSKVIVTELPSKFPVSRSVRLQRSRSHSRELRRLGKTSCSFWTSSVSAASTISMSFATSWRERL
jgi:hypothetical protein